MTDKKEKEQFILYARKMINNPLLKRKQLVVELIHPDQGSVSKAAIKSKLEAMFKVKPEAISVFGLHSKFGGGRSSGFACIYDDVDARKKCDTKSMLLRDKLREVPPKPRLPALPVRRDDRFRKDLYPFCLSSCTSFWKVHFVGVVAPFLLI